jgi:hypothetical protein
MDQFCYLDRRGEAAAGLLLEIKKYLRTPSRIHLIRRFNGDMMLGRAVIRWAFELGFGEC